MKLQAQTYTEDYCCTGVHRRVLTGFLLMQVFDTDSASLWYNPKAQAGWSQGCGMSQPVKL